MVALKFICSFNPANHAYCVCLKSPVNAPAWRYFEAINQPLVLQGPWQVKFIDGGEIIPHPETIDKLDFVDNLEQRPAINSEEVFGHGLLYNTPL